jgi:hypothetical protein
MAKQAAADRLDNASGKQVVADAAASGPTGEAAASGFEQFSAPAAASVAEELRRFGG